MANSLSAAKPQFWQDAFQTLWKPMSIYGQVAQMLSTEVVKGDRVHRPTTSDIIPQEIVLGTDLAVQDISTADEYLLVDKYDGSAIGIDNFDQKQTNIDLMKEEAKNMVRNLNNLVDAELQYLFLGSTGTVDAASLGGVAGVPLAVTGTNVYSMIAKAKQYQFENSFQNEDVFATLDPETFQTFETNGLGRETMYGDEVWKDGFTGRSFRYNGVDFYETSNYTRSMRLDYTGQPTDTNTLVITIGGTAVTVTFVATIGSAPGNVLIGASADATYTNLIGLLNDPGTTSATQVALSAANQRVFRPVAATQDLSGNTVTIYSKGKSLSITDATDNVTVNTTYTAKHLGLGKKRQSLSMALQITPSVEITQAPLQFRKYVLTNVSHGEKMFTDGANTAVELYLAA